MSSPEKASESQRYFWFRALVMCCLYLSVGPSLIVLNKHILQTLGFSYPVTLSSLGQIFIAAATWLFVSLGFATVSDEAREQVSGKGWISCFLVGLFKALTLSFGNAVYLHLNMGYIQMLKAFSPVLMLTLLIVTGVEKPPRLPVALSVLTIAVFTAATTALEANATFIGLVYMGMAQLTEALSLVLTQFLLKKKKLSIVESQYFLAPPAVLCLCTIAFFGGEWSSIAQHGGYLVVAQNPFMFVAAASLGLVVNFLTFAVIQATSSTMLKVLGTVRNIIAVVVGAYFYAEHIGGYEWLCYACTLGGFSSYTFFTMQAAREPQKS